MNTGNERSSLLSRDSLVDQRMFPVWSPAFRRLFLQGRKGRLKAVLQTRPFGVPLVKPRHPAWRSNFGITLQLWHLSCAAGSRAAGRARTGVHARAPD